MTHSDAALWMVDQLGKLKYLDQGFVAWELHKLDKDLTYQNANGNLAVSKLVLDEFSKITKNRDVVWSRSQRHWRIRETADRPGRMQE